MIPAAGWMVVVVPAYQAGSTLRDTLERIPPETWEAIGHLIVIDDGSTDDTLRIARKLAEENPKIRPLPNGRNLGYGPTVRRGLIEARSMGCEVAAILHADGQYPPERLLEFAAILGRRKLALLQGSRHLSGGARRGGMPIYKILAGKILVALENRVFALRLTDYHSGFLFHHRTALERIPYESLSDSFDFDLEVIACARAAGLPVGEEAIETRYADEVSHLRPIPYGMRVLGVLRRYGGGHYHRLVGRP